MYLKEELIAYELKMSVCSDKQAETKVDSYLSTTKPQHGGSRPNSGRKKGIETTTMRVPLCLKEKIKQFIKEKLDKL